MQIECIEVMDKLQDVEKLILNHEINKNYWVVDRQGNIKTKNRKYLMEELHNLKDTSNIRIEKYADSLIRLFRINIYYNLENRFDKESGNMINIKLHKKSSRS